MHKFVIDINADLGEGFNNEAQLIPLISSCNIACGGHAGNATIMRNVVKMAIRNKVKIGAHPSFPDRAHFGRVPMEMSPEALFTSVKNQIQTLASIVKAENGVIHHVKPHGALYNIAAKDDVVASVLVKVMETMHNTVRLYVPYRSVIANLAQQQNIPIIYEAFADRNYDEDLTLVPRRNPNAVLYDDEAVFKHVYRIVSKAKVKTITGALVAIKAQTFCVHGDNPKAIELLNQLKQRLASKGIIYAND